MGYLRTREHFTWPLVASEDKRVVLPVDLPIRQVVAFGRYAAYHPWQQINELRMDIDGGQRTPLNKIKVSDWLAYMSTYYGQIAELMRFSPTAGAELTTFVTPCYECVVTPISRSTAGHFKIGLPYGGAVGVTPEQSGDDYAMVHGFSPHGAIPIPMFRDDSPESYFDMGNRGSLDLYCLAGSSCASGNAQVVTQQLQRY
jgi:hypothetical protein